MWEMAFPGMYIEQNLKIFRGFAPGPHWGGLQQPPQLLSPSLRSVDLRLASLGISGG